MTDTTLHGTLDAPIVTMRSTADLVEALPYLFGYHPTDSIVVAGVHGPRKRIGGRLRLDLPDAPDEWPVLAPQIAEQLIVSSEAHAGRPDEALVYLCGPPPEKDGPAAPEEIRRQYERLVPYADSLRAALRRRGVPALEVLIVALGRWWCLGCMERGPGRCPPEGNPMARAGTPAIAAAAAFAGVAVRGTLRELDDELEPLGPPGAEPQRVALDEAAGAAITSIVGRGGAEEFRSETARLARAALDRFREAGLREGAPQADDPGPGPAGGEAALLSAAEAARLLVGLLDRRARDRAVDWVGRPDVAAARTLWRALARRCVAPYTEHATAPLALLGWARWVDGDATGARVALNRALRIDPGYSFAGLLHQAVNLGLGPGPLLESLRGANRREQEAEERRHET